MFKLSVVTPEKTVFEMDVKSIIAPGSEGYLGVLTNHAPIITALIPGKLTVIESDDRQVDYCISGGFLEVSGNIAAILADSIETVEQINLERAKKAEQRARERLARRSDDDIDVARAEAALARSINRQRIAEDR